MAVNFPEHITLAEAWKILETRFAKDADKFKTKMEITAALDHVLAEDILAGRNVPHYAASAVDGYALRSADTAGSSAATPAKVGAGKWQWMNTGAALPEWADCVLMVEDSSMEGEMLSVFKPLTPSANVRPLGEDVMAGQIIAREGTARRGRFSSRPAMKSYRARSGSRASSSVPEQSRRATLCSSRRRSAAGAAR